MELVQKKRCPKCQQWKLRQAFNKDRSKADGLACYCKKCQRAYARAYNKTYGYYQANKDKLALWREKNRKKIRSNAKRWREANIEKERARNAAYRKDNREKRAKQCREWHKANPDWQAEWRNANKEKANAYTRKYRRKKEQTDPAWNLNRRISRAILLTLQDKKNGQHWENLVGYTVQDLKCHLERRFKPGMTWDNYGEWHIDHIVPKSVFNFTSPEHDDFKRCWALKNLRPMWAKENISKGAKLEKHFQPRLAIG